MAQILDLKVCVEKMLEVGDAKRIVSGDDDIVHINKDMNRTLKCKFTKERIIRLGGDESISG